MYQIGNFLQNDDVAVIAQKGAFSVIEWKRDLSVSQTNAQAAWFAAEMNVRRRQVVCNLATSPVTVQAGAMQWSVGDVGATTGVKGVGDFLGKALRSAVTKESAIKPEYVGSGVLVLEPTYRYILLADVAEWGGGIVLDDGLFLASHSSLKHQLVARNNFSSAIAGGEGLFNLSLVGSGVAALESPCPQEELIVIDLQDDVLKIDGNMALAWSPSLQFTVERSGKTLIGSAASGEGLVNVYRGTGRVMMAPTIYGATSTPATSDGGGLGGMLPDIL
ncbi:AIM24 family protein [Eggerthellaceae bacterium zg-997]|nr:AIM24 family protein [Eggerthellaceae bacterium zg-997]